MFYDFLILYLYTLKFNDGVQHSSQHDGINEVNSFYCRGTVPSARSASYLVNAQYVPSKSAVRMLTLFQSDLIYL